MSSVFHHKTQFRFRDHTDALIREAFKWAVIPAQMFSKLHSFATSHGVSVALPIFIPGHLEIILLVFPQSTFDNSQFVSANGLSLFDQPVKNVLLALNLQFGADDISALLMKFVQPGNLTKEQLTLTEFQLLSKKKSTSYSENCYLRLIEQCR